MLKNERIARLVVISLAITFLFMGSNAFAESGTKKVSKLDTVVITATKTEHTLGDVPVAISVITKEEIEAKNIKTVQDALKSLTGVTINKSCSSWGNKGNIEIQGLNAKYTLILVDGQKIHGGMDAVDVQSYPIEMIERIEVVKGPASALYGSDAIGGVVNIITKFAPEKPAFTVSTAFGSRRTQIHEVSGGFKTGKLGSSLSFAHRESDGVHLEYLGSMPANKKSDQYDEDIIQGSFQYEFTPESKISLRPYYSKHKMKEGVSATEMQNRFQERFSLNSIWEWAPDDLSTLSLRGSLFNYKYYTTDRSSDWIDDNYEAELNYSRLILDKHTLTGGYHYQIEEIDDNGKDYKANQYLHSFFIQDEMDFSPFVLVLGMRVDEHDKWGTKVNPKVNLLYEMSKDLKLKASVGTAFRAPTLVKLYADNWVMGKTTTVHANSELKPEESIGYQLGAEYRFSEKLSGGLSFFKNEIDDMISYRTTGMGMSKHMYWENIDEAVTQGIELNLDSQLMDNLTGKLGYTFLDTENKTTKKELTKRPKHKLTLDLGYKIPQIDFSMNLECEYIGKRYDDADNTDRLGGYTMFNLALTKDIGKYAQVFARVDNVFGKKDVFDEYDIDGTEFLSGLKLKF